MLIKTNFAFTYKVITILTITSLLPLAWIYSVIAASGLTYFVDKTNSSCSDAGNGLTAAQPFCSIGKGASVAVAGDTLRVLAGSYAETVSVPKSGSVDLPITYSAEPGVTITGNGSASGGDAFQISSKSYVIIDGFNIINTADNGIYVSGSNHITISNNHVSYSGKPISGSTRQGIYLTGTTDSTISGNTTDHNTQDGIRLTNGSINNMVTHNISFANAEQWQRNAAGIHVNGSGSYNNTLIHNITYANEDTGLQFYDNAHNNSLIGNLTYGNGDHGIDISNAPYNTAIGNTVQGNHTSGINYEGNSGTSGSSGAIIMNNVSVDNGIAPLTGRKSNIRVDASSIPGTSMDYNLVYYTSTGSVQIEWNGVTYATLAAFKAAVPGQEVHGLQSNPRFIAPVLPAGRPPAEVIGDYHVAASSPVIDSAYANAMNETLLDLDGNVRVDDPATADTGDGARTYDDRGAFEFQQGGLSTAIPTVVLTATPTATPNSTMSFIPIADAHVRLARPTTNYGTNTSLMVAGGTASYESYLKFTVSGLNNTVKSATLRLYVTNATVDGPAAFGTDPNWTETGLTWNNRPAITSIGMDDKGIISANSWVEFNVTPLVTADGTYSFALIGSSTDGVTFSSRQGSQVPQLVISTINGSYTSTPITTPSMTPTSTTTNIPTDLTSTTPTTTPTIIPPTAISSPTSTYIPTATYTTTATNPPLTAITFLPNADTYARLSGPTTNYGTSTVLYVAGGTASYETYIKFSISGISGIVNNATLRLYASNGSVDGPAAFGTDPNWTETGLTWNNRPAITSIGMDDKGIISANSWVEFNVTPLVTADGTYSFALIGSSTDGVTFSSRQGSQVPQLVISTINGSYTSTPITTPSMTPTSTTTNIPTDLTSTTPTTTPTIIPPTAISSPTSTYIPTATYTTTATNPPLTAITFLPNADTFARLSGPTTNYGTSTVLYVAGGTASYETYIKFSISGISGIVNNATLRLYASNGSVDGPAAFGTDPNWTETGLTWNNRPAITSIGMDDKGIISANSWVEFNVTPLVTGDGTYSFALIGSSTDGVTFSSRQGSQVPQLVISTINGSYTSTPIATPSMTPTSTTTIIPTAITSTTPTTTPTIIPPTAISSPTSTYTPTPVTPTAVPPTPTPTTIPGTGLTFITNADSYVREAGPTSNYGTNTQLWIGTGVGVGYESYLLFNVSGVPGSVQSATLRLYSTSATVDGPAVFSTSSTWTETGITWNSRPALTSSGMDDKGAIATGVWIEYNVTPLVTGDGTYSFGLVSSSTDSVSFSSRQGSQPPQLVLSFGP